jgi:hypothetical protein
LTGLAAVAIAVDAMSKAAALVKIRLVLVVMI